MKSRGSAKPLHNTLDFKLLESALGQFQLSGLEALRLEVMASGCKNNVETAKEFIGAEWDAMTVKLLFNGFIEMPRKGRTKLTSKAMRFLAICHIIINQN